MVVEKEVNAHGQCPTVLVWGRAPFAIQHNAQQQRTIYYPNGMQLEIKLADDLVLVETIRVIDDKHCEHRFQQLEVTSDWNKSRLLAFQQCIAKLGRRHPPKRAVIFGPSHHSIQGGILERFGKELALENASLLQRAKKKVSWGDAHAIVTDSPSHKNNYGGWGLETIKIIPNRFELRQMSVSWDEGDDEDFDLIEEDVLRLRIPSFSYEDENDAEYCESKHEEDMTVHPSEGEEETFVEEVVEGNAENSEFDNGENLPPTPALLSSTNDSKRQRMIPENEMVEQLPTNDVTSKTGGVDPLPLSPPPVVEKEQVVCAPTSFEDEIKAFDQWLLQHEFVI